MTDTVLVKANANVLGMLIGESREIARDTPELAACIRLGTIEVVDAHGLTMTEKQQITPPRRCCGG